MLSGWEAESPVCDNLPSAAATVSSGHSAVQSASSQRVKRKKGDEVDCKRLTFNFLVFPAQDAAVDSAVSNKAER